MSQHCECEEKDCPMLAKDAEIESLKEKFIESQAQEMRLVGICRAMIAAIKTLSPSCGQTIRHELSIKEYGSCLFCAHAILSRGSVEFYSSPQIGKSWIESYEKLLNQPAPPIAEVLDKAIKALEGLLTYPPEYCTHVPEYEKAKETLAALQSLRGEKK